MNNSTRILKMFIDILIKGVSRAVSILTKVGEQLQLFSNYLNRNEKIHKIIGSVKEWREKNPDVKKISILGRKDITDDDFQYFQGIHTLIMIECDQSTITDQAFSYLKGIHTLHMSGCNQSTITDQAFSYLKGIHTLFMDECDQPTITDQAFSYLQGIKTIDITGCNQSTITDQAFTYLKDSHILHNRRNPKTYLIGIKDADMSL